MALWHATVSLTLLVSGLIGLALVVPPASTAATTSELPSSSVSEAIAPAATTPPANAHAVAFRGYDDVGEQSRAHSVVKPPRRAAKADTGLSSRGLRPAPGTRVRPGGIPEGWRVRPTREDSGTWYYDPTNKGNAVRVMQGDPKSPFPNSQAPYVRWQRNGQPLDASGNVLTSKFSPDAHIPLSEFKFRPDLFE